MSYAQPPPRKEKLENHYSVGVCLAAPQHILVQKNRKGRSSHASLSNSHLLNQHKYLSTYGFTYKCVYYVQVQPLEFPPHQ